MTFFLLYTCIVAIGGGVVLFFALRLLTSPSNNRDWAPDQKILPYGVIEGDNVSLFNIRNFAYISVTKYKEQYYDKIFDVRTIKRVWYVVEPFSGIPGSAHTFLSFEFEEGVFLAFSIEIRKRKGQEFHPIKGLFNQYELMYVIADENDVVKLRSNYRKDPVYVYPARAPQEKVKMLFLHMVKSANMLREHPQFYNTITHNCTTEIVRHINAITPKSVPLFSLAILFPEYSDKLAYNLGLLDTTLSFEKAREKFRINERAEKYKDDPHFSGKIREG